MSRNCWRTKARAPLLPTRSDTTRPRTHPAADAETVFKALPAASLRPFRQTCVAARDTIDARTRRLALRGYAEGLAAAVPRLLTIQQVGELLCVCACACVGGAAALRGYAEGLAAALPRLLTIQQVCSRTLLQQ